MGHSFILKKIRKKRAARKRLSGEQVDFIPEGDSEFACKARKFFECLEANPDRYGATPEDIWLLRHTVKSYRDALSKTMVKQHCTPSLVFEKDKTRKEAEKLIRSWGNHIRAHPEIEPTHKKLAGVHERPTKLKKRTCPKAPPILKFEGSTPDGTQHILRIVDALDEKRRKKPPGAVRWELFIDFVPPGEPVPATPSDRGWPKYVRSFTSNPEEFAFPVPSQPMLIVYWAKWADSTGETSPWSKTCVARVEGWSASAPALPESQAKAIETTRVETKYIIVHAPHLLPETVEQDEVIDMRQKLLDAVSHERAA